MNHKMLSFIKDHFEVFLVGFIFLLLTVPYWGQVPALDQLVVYRESIVILEKGLKGLIDTGVPLHPPFLYFLYNVSFLLGKNVSSVNILGFVIYMFCAYYYSSFVKKSFNRQLSVITTVLFFSSPLVILHSFYLCNDFLILAAIIFLIASLQQKQWGRITVMLTIMTLMKETALIAAVVLYCLSCIEILRTNQPLKSKFALMLIIIVPAVLSILYWRYTLTYYHATEWVEKSFGVTQSSSFLVVIDNVLHGKLLTRFLYGNLFNTFVMNFQWLFTETAIAGLAYVIFKKMRFTSEQMRFLIYLFLVTFLYIITVFTFPTWTLARYGVPVYPLLFLLAGIFIINLPKTFRYSLCCCLIGINLIANVSSVDSVTAGKLPPLIVQNISFYSTNVGYNGYTMVDYNIQYLQALRNQNNSLKEFFHLSTLEYRATCSELKVGEKIWTMQMHPTYYPGYLISSTSKYCKNWWEN